MTGPSAKQKRKPRERIASSRLVSFLGLPAARLQGLIAAMRASPPANPLTPAVPPAAAMVPAPAPARAPTRTPTVAAPTAAAPAAKDMLDVGRRHRFFERRRREREGRSRRGRNRQHRRAGQSRRQPADENTVHHNSLRMRSPAPPYCAFRPELRVNGKRTANAGTASARRGVAISGTRRRQSRKDAPSTTTRVRIGQVRWFAIVPK